MSTSAPLHVCAPLQHTAKGTCPCVCALAAPMAMLITLCDARACLQIMHTNFMCIPRPRALYLCPCAGCEQRFMIICPAVHRPPLGRAARLCPPAGPAQIIMRRRSAHLCVGHPRCGQEERARHRLRPQHLQQVGGGMRAAGLRGARPAGQSSSIPGASSCGLQAAGLQASAPASRDRGPGITMPFAMCTTSVA